MRRYHGIVAEKKTARHRETMHCRRYRNSSENPKIGANREIEFCFCAVDDGFAEGDWEADGCVVDLIVVRIVVYVRRK